MITNFYMPTRIVAGRQSLATIDALACDLKMKPRAGRLRSGDCRLIVPCRGPRQPDRGRDVRRAFRRMRHRCPLLPKALEVDTIGPTRGEIIKACADAVRGLYADIGFP
ncbi:MAG: hypothetical protein INR62_10215, partial [Rhodospirillales bacterium]|nr:hypothetical protein [Acetobacter sp.]